MNSVNGQVLIKPDQTVDVEVCAREREHIEASGWFTTEGSYETDPHGSGKAPATNSNAAGRIAELKGEVKAKDAEIVELKKKAPKADVDKMTVPELRAHRAFHDVAFDSKKDQKADLQAKAKTVKPA